MSDVSDVRYVRYLFLEIIELHIEASHLICIANQMTGFYMKSTKYFSYRSQSFDLHCKSNDWFLYEKYQISENNPFL